MGRAGCTSSQVLLLQARPLRALQAWFAAWGLSCFLPGLLTQGLVSLSGDELPARPPLGEAVSDSSTW